MIQTCFTTGLCHLYFITYNYRKMDYNNTTLLVTVYTISNIVGLLFLWAAIKKPKLARLLFLLLFAWASWMNFSTSRNLPEVYLDYTQFAIGPYKAFINGWFQYHISAMVGLIALGQAMIAAGMLLTGIWLRLACIGAIIFMLAIAPLGVGAAFPFSITVSLAAYFILRKDDKNFLWEYKTHHRNVVLPQ